MFTKKSQKRLLVFIPSIEDGGVEKNLFLIINFLSKKIGNIDLITYDYHAKNRFNKKINIICPFFNFINFNSRLPKYFFCLSVLISKLLFNRNYVVLSFQANIYVIILSQILGIDVISRSNSSSTGWSKNFFKQFIFSYFFKRANKIIVNSFDFKKEMDKKYKVKSICILNPFNFKDIIKKSKKKSKKIFFKKKSIKIISAGRLTYQKDFLTLLKAINIIKNKKSVELIIIGKGSEKQNLENYVKVNNLNNNIKFIGYQTNPFKYIKQSDIFVLTSLFEGSPNVLVEAMKLKKYVISTDCPTGPREILNNGKYGSLVPLGSYKEIANIIINFKLNSKIKTKINKGYKSLKKYDHNLNCKKYFDIIKDQIQIK